MLNFLTAKISAYIIGGMGALLLVTIGVEELRIHNWKADLKTEQDAHEICKTNLTTATNNVTVMKRAVARCNIAIDEWKKKASAADETARAQALVVLERGEEMRKADAANPNSGPDEMNSWLKELFQ